MFSLGNFDEKLMSFKLFAHGDLAPIVGKIRDLMIFTLLTWILKLNSGPENIHILRNACFWSQKILSIFFISRPKHSAMNYSRVKAAEIRCSESLTIPAVLLSLER